ncbi:MAG TPA: metal ABC transporter substrate-binding protein [Thermoanaerobaculia bacterium]|nr:metal ABC transporter substrate-binding protein [Thermoanaerobaculia bacterium]
MRTPKNKSVFDLTSCLCLAAMAALAVPAAAEDAPRVAATIFPLYDIVREVGGTAVEAVVVLSPGASPHTFEMRPASAKALARAALLFRVGHGLDDWAVRLAEAAGVGRIVTADAGVRLRRFADGGVDPHYWLAGKNGKAIARTVGEELARLVPARRVEIEGRLAAYLVRLDTADAQVRRLLHDLPSRSIATLHDGFGYFADAYGLTVVAVFEASGGKEPGPRSVAEFERRVRAGNVRVIFAEPQISPDVIRSIARDLRVPIATLDDLGGVPGRDSYVALLLFDAQQVAAALK